MGRLASGVGLACLLAATGWAAEAGDKDSSAAFSVACSNAWIKTVTAKDPCAYAVGEDIAFSVTLEGVTNAIPQGLFSYKWKRTGDDGVAAEGLAPVEKKPFVYTTKLEKPGAVRFTVDMVGKDGKPFLRTIGAKKEPLRFAAGALIAPDRLQPRAEPADFVKYHKELLRRLGRPAFKKQPRQAVPYEDVKVVTLSRVELPSPSAHPVKGLLSVPTVAAEGTKLPCCLRFSPVGYDKDVPLPKAQDVRLQEIVLTLAYDPGKAGARDEAFCTDLYLEVVRALQYLKSLPEWDGKGLSAEGWGVDGLLAVWAAGSGEGVTKLVCANLPLDDLGFFDPVRFARHLDPACRVTIPRAGLGDAAHPPSAVAAFWNALSCDRSLLWVQGAEGWSVPHGFKGRDVRWEKLTPVRFVRMDTNHAKVERGLAHPYTDVELALRDKIVVEIVFDYAKTSLDVAPLAQIKTYGAEALVPLEVYAVVPEKKVKDKVWAQFMENLKKSGSNGFPFPVYLNAGMDLPVPGRLPWFHLTDQEGMLRYSGNSLSELNTVYRGLVAKLPKADPVFAYAKPVLLADMVEKCVKAKVTGPKLYKVLDMEMKKAARKDPALADEARHLMLGMRQAVDRRIQALVKAFNQRPGRGYCDLLDLLAEWPELATNAKVVGLKDRVAKNPDIEKLAKLEKELDRLLSWSPARPADIKKKTVAVDAFRKKLEKLANSPNATTQGEALLITTDLDNPPQPEQK